jgi:hypothetical protein
MIKFNFPNSIIAGANLFSCCFFTVFAIESFMPHNSLSIIDLLLIQSIVSVICYLGKTPILVGIGIAPWLYLNQSQPFNPLTSSDYQDVFLITGFCFALLSFTSWTKWIKPYFMYQPGVSTACCFSALLLEATMDTLQTLPSMELLLTGMAIAALILFEKRHQHYTPFLVFILLLCLSSEWVNEKPSLPFSNFVVDLSGIVQHPLTVIKASVYLFSIMVIDLSTCLMAITPVLQLKDSCAKSIRKTQALNSLIAGFFGAGQTLIYFENVVLKSFSETERFIAPIFSGLLFLVMAAGICYLKLNVALLSSVFSLYLFYLVLKGALSKEMYENSFIFIISLLIFELTTLNYIQTLAIVSAISHHIGAYQQRISPKNLKKNNVFCLIIFTFNFILKN